jgi:hypothetical protein
MCERAGMEGMNRRMRDGQGQYGRYRGPADEDRRARGNPARGNPARDDWTRDDWACGNWARGNSARRNWDRGDWGRGGWGGGDWRRGNKMGRGRGIDRMLDMIELYDQDGDRKITQAEVDKARADRLAEFDRDGDGMLSLDEYEALWLDAMRERMVDRFQAHDDDGDGKVTVVEFSKQTSRLVMRRDRNDDGALSVEDLRRGERGRRPMRGPRAE